MRHIKHIMIGVLACSATICFAGTLEDSLLSNHKAEGVAGAIVAARTLRNVPRGEMYNPFLNEMVLEQKGAETFLRTPHTVSATLRTTGKLIWEYGPLSPNQIRAIANMDDMLRALVRENPELKSNPEGLAKTLSERVANINKRLGQFSGNQAEFAEAASSDLRLTRSRVSEVHDLHSPKNGTFYQQKVYGKAYRTLSSLLDDQREFAKTHPNEAPYFNGKILKAQIDELVRGGKLVVAGKAASGEQIYEEPQTRTKVYAMKSSYSTQEVRARTKEALRLHDQLAKRRIGGVGKAVVGGAGAGALIGGGIEAGRQLYDYMYNNAEYDGLNVLKSAGIGAGFGAGSALGTAILAEQLNQKLGEKIVAKLVERGLERALAETVATKICSYAAGGAVGCVIVIGVNAWEFYQGNINARDFYVQSGIGGASVFAGMGAGIIVTWATAGTILGSEVPIVGNACGFVVGAVAGVVVFIGGSYVYENWKLPALRAEQYAYAVADADFERYASRKDIERLQTEARSLRESALLGLSQ